MPRLITTRDGNAKIILFCQSQARRSVSPIEEEEQIAVGEDDEKQQRPRKSPTIRSRRHVAMQ